MRSTNTAKRYPLLSVLFLFILTSIMQAEEATKTDTWEKKSHSISGTWTLVKENDSTVLKLSDDFKTKRAPDLKIFLSPLTLEELNGDNAVDGSLFIADLEKNKGAQSYTLPEDADLSKYQTLIIHCEKYAKLWGGAKL